MMQNIRFKILSILLILAFAAMSAACVEAENPGAEGDGDSSAIDPGGDQDGEQYLDTLECNDGERVNPYLGECVPKTPNNYFHDPSLDPDPEENGDNGDDEGNGGVDCGFGSIHGQACGTGGAHLPAATVHLAGVDCEGQYFEMTRTTDGQGIFLFDNVPAGHHELLVTSGSFSQERNVDVTDGQVTNLLSDAEKVCVAGDVKIMVMKGGWDDISGLLDELELEYDETPNVGTQTINFLSDPAELAEYDIIFFECGHSFFNLQSGDVNLMMNNLRDFVQGGNSIYASDMAYRFFNETFPDAATFTGFSLSNQSVTATVVSSPMQTLLGSNTTSIFYDIVSFGVDEAFPPTVVHFEGAPGSQAAGKPLMISYTAPPFNGTAIYTSFHNNETASGDDERMEILNFMIFQL